jgi:hypothetical protein
MKKNKSSLTFHIKNTLKPAAKVNKKIISEQNVVKNVGRKFTEESLFPLARACSACRTTIRTARATSPRQQKFRDRIARRA